MKKLTGTLPLAAARKIPTQTNANPRPTDRRIAASGPFTEPRGRGGRTDEEREDEQRPHHLYRQGHGHRDDAHEENREELHRHAAGFRGGRSKVLNSRGRYRNAITARMSTLAAAVTATARALIPRMLPKRIP